jgi:hypothetical protein
LINQKIIDPFKFRQESNISFGLPLTDSSAPGFYYFERYLQKLMDELKQIFRAQNHLISRNKIKTLLKEYGNMKLDEVKLDQAFGGMEGN